MRYKRTGLTILELTVASVVVAVLAVAVVQLVAVMAGQQRAVARRHVAIQECANVMERAFGRRWEALTSEGLEAFELSPEARRSLPGARLAIEVAQSDTQPDAKRITVTIRWPGRPGTPEHTVRLVAWRYCR
ncbi:MAG TPA: hypothetical protein EYP56_22555 [Planctomycetaceae bacterium]|nr:hypothetical protein [Planctomycetaceae bacterium]